MPSHWCFPHAIALLTGLLFLETGCRSHDQQAPADLLSNPVELPQGISVHNNIPRGTLSYTGAVFSHPESAEALRAKFPPMADDKFTVLPKRDVNNSKFASGGTHVIANGIQPGSLIGVSGLGPCIGVLVLQPEMQEVFAFHFAATDHVGSTLSQYRFAAGSRVVVFGGDSEPESRRTLAAIERFFRGRQFVREGYLDVSGLHVDANGKYFVHQVELGPGRN